VAQSYGPAFQEITLPEGMKIKWGRGIQDQGMPWENYLASILEARLRLPQNFKTFDFYDDIKGLAISAKTLNTQTASRIARPERIYQSLKKNIDDTLKFQEHRLSGKTVEKEWIKTRRLEVAIPKQTTPDQITQIQRAIDYGRTNGVQVNIKITD
jgi:filamentous hemagglutinin